MTLHPSLPVKRPRVIFTDVDDTVAPSTHALDATMATALMALHDSGIQLVFVSGAAMPQMLVQVSPQLPRPHVLLGTSGSHAVAMDAGPHGLVQRELFHKGFDQRERADILEALKALVKHFDIKPDTTEADQLQDRGCQFTLSALGHAANDARKRAYDPDGSRRREWVGFLADKLGAGRFSLRVGGTTSIDITAPGVDKGWGVRELLKLQGWKAEDCLYFGDRFEETGNDYPVLAVLDCVAVKHPAETLKHFQALLAR